MIKLNVLAFAIIIVACQSNGKETPAFILDNNHKTSDNQIHLLYKDFKVGDWAFSYFDSYDQQNKITCPPNKSVNIEWAEDNVFALQTIPFQGYYPVSAGDTIVITRAAGIEHPAIEILNSKFSFFEINFPGFLSNRNCSILEYSFRKMMPDKRIPVIGTAKDNYEKSIFILDSCKRIGLVNEAYHKWLMPVLKFSYYRNAMKENEFIPNFTRDQAFDTTSIENFYYRSFLQNYFIKNELKTTWGSIDFRKAYNFASQQYSGVIKDYLTFFCLINILEIYPQQRKEFIKKFEADCATKKYENYILKNYPLANIDGANGKDQIMRQNLQAILLDNLIKQNKGNLMYIDFWASWCIPCRIEMPASIKLKAKYRNQSIRFIYLSIDSQVEPWQKASKDDSLSNYDNNFLLLNPQSSLLVKQLKISAIPRYIIIGKNGKVIHADAPRPGDYNLEVLLDKLLSQ